MVKPAIVILGASALPLAKAIKSALGGRIHAPAAVKEADEHFARAAIHIASLFRDGTPIVGLCASGILIRAVASLVGNKHSEPPVVAVAEDGSAAVPLLGGHHGANDLARRIAKAAGGQAAITTASEVRFGEAFDVPPPGHVLGNPSFMKEATARRLAGEEIGVVVTDRRTYSASDSIVLHPKTLAIGVGCSRGASASEIAGLIEHTLGQAGLARESVACLASIDVKEDEAGIHAAAASLGAPVRFFTAEDLRREAPRLRNPSAIVEQEVGTPGVAEAAALAAAGSASELAVEKQKSANATCAIARASGPILTLAGRSRGVLHVVGIGPGNRDWRAPAARLALEAASDWVGYGLYLDLIADLRHDQIEHRFPLGGEEDRVRHAIALARTGREVALVCSGDAGIYAMAALVYEIADIEPNRIAIAIIPGISAFQAAAARTGALIGHDFCCISLSDLLTPWDDIERRIRAAAEGDFVVAFYNPRSHRRRDQLDRAVAVLRQHRPGGTPVIVASNLGRPDERADVLTLAQFDPGMVDMLTVVLVGSSHSRTIKRGDGRTYAYTPRGYAKKREAAE